jgi:hypothetical protein
MVIFTRVNELHSLPKTQSSRPQSTRRIGAHHMHPVLKPRAFNAVHELAHLLCIDMFRLPSLGHPLHHLLCIGTLLFQHLQDSSCSWLGLNCLHGSLQMMP